MDWLDLLAVQGTLKSLLQHHSSKASILQCSTLFTTHFIQWEMFVYSSSIKICASGFDQLLESTFCLLFVVEAYSLQKNFFWDAWRSGSWLVRRWIWQMKQKFVIQCVQCLKRWLCQHLVGCEVRCCHAEESGPFCWPTVATGIAVFGAPHQFAEHTSQM